MAQKNIVIVGYLLLHTLRLQHRILTSTRAGVAGLTTALLLSKEGRYNIVVAAKHMPGDYDIDYASPWAGGNYMPYVALPTPTNLRN